MIVGEKRREEEKNFYLCWRLELREARRRRMDIPKKKKEEVERVLGEVMERVVVVSGPGGCGKSRVIEEVCKNKGYAMVEIQSLREYSRRRIKRNILYYLDADAVEEVEIEKENVPYRGLVIETRNSYLIKKFKYGVGVNINRVGKRVLKKLRMDDQMVNGSYHRIEMYGIKGREVFLGGVKEEVSFYHLLGKIFYSEAGGGEKEVLDLLVEGRHDVRKTVYYLHENLLVFFMDLESVRVILGKLSDVVDSDFDISYVIIFVTEIMKRKKVRPGVFYQFRPYKLLS